MIESLIISLREGIEIALVLGILVVYLQKINQKALVASVYAGLAAAVAASIGGALVLQHLSLDQELLEGYLMLLAAVFVISMVVWMWISAKRIRGDIQDRVDSIVQTSAQWRSHARIFLFSFLMILREGIETALFLQAVALSTGAVRSILGTVIGLSAAALFAVLFIRGSVKIDIGRFLKVTAITLVLFTLQLVVNAFHEFFEFGVLPASPKAMGILGPIVQHEVLFILAIVSIPAIMLIIPGKGKPPAPPPSSNRRWQLSAGVVSLCIVFFLGMGEVYSSDPEMDLSSQFVGVPSDGVLKIPLDKVDDGNIHRYSINDHGLEIRFFVLRMGLGTYATAFDACYACYSYGRYFLRKGELICSLCDAPTPMARLKASKGDEEPDPDNSGSMEGNGCAPIYLPSHIHRGEVLITLGDLLSKRKYFDISTEEK